MAATPELQTLIREAIQSFLDDLRVATPGIVVSYDPTTRRAAVQPAVTYPIQRQDGSIAFERPAAIDNVPCVFPGGGGLDLHLPLSPGDGVALVSLDVSPARWLGTGVVSDSPDVQRNSGAYMIAIPAVWTNLDAVGSDADASIGHKGGLRIHFGTSSIRVGVGSDFVAMAAKVLTELTAIKTAFDAHIHPVAAAPGNSGPPATPMPSPGAVASSDLKAD